MLRIPFLMAGCQGALSQESWRTAGRKRPSAAHTPPPSYLSLNPGAARLASADVIDFRLIKMEIVLGEPESVRRKVFKGRLRPSKGESARWQARCLLSGSPYLPSGWPRVEQLQLTSVVSQPACDPAFPTDCLTDLGLARPVIHRRADSLQQVNFSSSPYFLSVHTHTPSPNGFVSVVEL